jgi:hypothetical protein
LIILTRAAGDSNSASFIELLPHKYPESLILVEYDRRMSVQKLSQFYTHILSVIKMECVQKQQTTHCVEKPTLIRIKKKTVSKQIDVYDKASAELRRHLASEEAIRQLEQRKAQSSAMVYRMSFMR